MEADADNHSEEGIPLFGVYAHIMKIIIIQDPVIHPLTESAVIVNFLVFCHSSWNRSVKADVPVWFCVDTAAIKAGFPISGKSHRQHNCHVRSPGRDLLTGMSARSFWSHEVMLMYGKEAEIKKQEKDC